MSAEIIHCRLSSDTLKRLDGHAAALRKQGVPPRLTTRSSVVRVLLAQQLDSDPDAVDTLAVMAQTQKLLHATSARALQKVLDRLPHALDAVAAESVGMTLQQIVAAALRRVCDALPDAEAITSEVLAEDPPALKLPPRKR